MKTTNERTKSDLMHNGAFSGFVGLIRIHTCGDGELELGYGM
jgi:hypothetical protein